MNALGQKPACARRASMREEMGRRGNGNATEAKGIPAQGPKVARTSLLPWLDVEDHARPGAAIWIAALAAMICIGLAYAYFTYITG